MKKLGMKKYLICGLLLFHTIAKAQNINTYNNEDININVKLKSGEIMSLWYLDDFLIEQRLSFKNTSKNDTTIIKRVYSNNILELRYGVTNGLSNKSYNNVFYVKKGDTISIALNDLALKNLSTNKFLFVDDFLKVSLTIAPEAGDFESIKKVNKSILDLNLKKIDSLLLNKELTDSIASLWREVSQNYYYLKLSRAYNRGSSLDELVKELSSVLVKKTIINSNFLKSAIYRVANYRKIKNNLQYNLLTFIEEVNKIQTEQRYKTGVAYEGLSYFPEKTSKSYLDSYAFFTKYLYHPSFQSQNYSSSINPNIVSFNKSIVKLITPQNKALTLDDIFKKNKGKIMVFDFWASWCGPCRQEMPYANQLKKKYKSSDVVFVNISIDKDIDNWLKANKEENLGNEFSFLLLNAGKSPFTKMYNITTIPRYILIDKNGKVVNENAPRPSDLLLADKIDKLLLK